MKQLDLPKINHAYIDCQKKNINSTPYHARRINVIAHPCELPGHPLVAPSQEHLGRLDARPQLRCLCHPRPGWPQPCCLAVSTTLVVTPSPVHIATVRKSHCKIRTLFYPTMFWIFMMVSRVIHLQNMEDMNVYWHNQCMVDFFLIVAVINWYKQLTEDRIVLCCI